MIEILELLYKAIVYACLHFYFQYNTDQEGWQYTG